MWCSIFKPNPAARFRTRAAFSRDGGRTWRWVTWTHGHANKHAAIIAKARELGADTWDFGNADHNELSRADY